MKTCGKCGESKPATTEFFPLRSPQGGGRFQSYCRACACAYTKEYYQRNKHKASQNGKLRYAAERPKRLAAAAAYRAAHLEESRARNRAYKHDRPTAVMFREWRSAGCVVCGESDVRVIQAHHVDPAIKDSDIAQIRKDVEAMAAELTKCIPLCANHHILVHDALCNGHRGRPMDEVIAFLKGE